MSMISNENEFVHIVHYVRLKVCIIHTANTVDPSMSGKSLSMITPQQRMCDYMGLRQ